MSESLLYATAFFTTVIRSGIKERREHKELVAVMRNHAERLRKMRVGR